MPGKSELDLAALDRIRKHELAELRARTPRSRNYFSRSRLAMPDGVPCSWMASFYPGMEIVADRGKGAYFTDIDGNRYLDMSQCDLSMSCGFGPDIIANAVSERFRNGSHFLLPTEDALAVCQLLTERFAMPAWRFTLSASSANLEAIRIARVFTGRDKVLSFGGKYHGHIDETLTVASPTGLVTDQKGLPRDIVNRTVEIPFNDIVAVKEALETRGIACVIAEPVMTNIGVIYPEDGYLNELRALTRITGTLLVIDETHTQVAHYGGFTRRWALEPDILTLGKSLGGGLPFGAYGMTEQIKDALERNAEPRVKYCQAIALGGTTYGNAINMAAARAALSEVLTEEAYRRVGKLGDALADGICSALRKFDLPWTTQRLGNRSGLFLSATQPRNAAEAQGALSKPFNLAQRAFMANRGIWEPIYIHGPSLSFAHEFKEVLTYLAAFDEWIALIVKNDTVRTS
jgi:glutamate-1-semialdehyde 2,1-aminomutase